MVLLQRRAAALFLFAFIFLMPISHAHSREKTDIKTLVIGEVLNNRSLSKR